MISPLSAWLAGSLAGEEFSCASAGPAKAPDATIAHTAENDLSKLVIRPPFSALSLMKMWLVFDDIFIPSTGQDHDTLEIRTRMIISATSIAESTMSVAISLNSLLLAGTVSWAVRVGAENAALVELH